MRTLQPEIERAVALVNVDARTAATLAAVLVDAGERDVALSEADVRQLGGVLDDLRRVFAAADRDEAAARLNDLLAAHAGPPRLVRHEGWDWHVHVDRADDAPWAEWLGASAASALATRLASATTSDPGIGGLPWGVCASADCTDVFVHDGRGGPRQWCSTTCASRERVRRHRALHRDPPTDTAPGASDQVSRRRTRPGRRARAGASATG